MYCCGCSDASELASPQPQQYTYDEPPSPRPAYANATAFPHPEFRCRLSIRRAPVWYVVYGFGPMLIVTSISIGASWLEIPSRTGIIISALLTTGVLQQVMLGNLPRTDALTFAAGLPSLSPEPYLTTMPCQVMLGNLPRTDALTFADLISLWCFAFSAAAFVLAATSEHLRRLNALSLPARSGCPSAAEAGGDRGF